MMLRRIYGGKMWQDVGKYYMLWSFITCTLHEILFG
jgi:hypothetical protein